MIQRELYLALHVEIFDGCDHTWILGLDNLELVGNNVSWLKGALKERGIRILGKNKRDMIEELLEWERRRTAQVILWGNPRYCQVGGVHEPHKHPFVIYRESLADRLEYWCDGRETTELIGYVGA